LSRRPRWSSRRIAALGLVLAVFFSALSWLITWRSDQNKLVAACVVLVLGSVASAIAGWPIGTPQLVVWVWCIADHVYVLLRWKANESTEPGAQLEQETATS
jgi:hypothetical protein